MSGAEPTRKEAAQTTTVILPLPLPLCWVEQWGPVNGQINFLH